MEKRHKEIAKMLREWIHEAEHYSVVHFAVEIGMSKEELFRIATEDEDLQRAVDYAMSVQEWKVSEGAMSGHLEKAVALKMLETYSGWKGDVNILQKNEYKQYMNEAQRRAGEILGRGVEMEGMDVGKDNEEDTGRG